jgi:Heparinase II/III-like protein/Heparinase II/III N-terminus
MAESQNMIRQGRLSWLVNRLLTMELGELLARISHVRRHVIFYGTLKNIRPHAEGQSECIDSLLKASDIDRQLERVGQTEQCRIIAEAVQWLDHKANFFALRNEPLGDPIEWHRDYSSGVVGPLKYSGLINYRQPAIAGDVKYIWELNRLQHLVLLALAATWTGSEVYRDEIKRQILSWCAQNPFMKGLNWKSPLEAGIRLISWAYVSFLMGGDSQTSDLFCTHLREIIYQHHYFIWQFYSQHSSANNHLIGEMTGLYVGSIFWPWYRESAHWRSFARRKLIEEIARQVEVDGVSKERATEYQLFVLEFFLLAGALGHAVDDPFPREYWERVGQMITFLAAISDRERNLPMFGDGDSAQVAWLPETPQMRLRSLLQLGGSCPGAVDEPLLNVRSLLLLWGQTREQIPLPTVPEPHNGLQAFPQGGYYVLATDRGREDEMLAVFDAGPLGFAPLYAHGHADALSFWLSYGGHEFIIDPGTFCYYANDSWRSYFRSTAAHNTVRIDGEDQSVAGGRFLWCRAAHCQAQSIQMTDDFIEVTGFHDGYSRLIDPVVHRRSIRLFTKTHTLVLTDRIECRKNHDIELSFHFSEKCQVQQVGLTLFIASHGDKCLSFHLDSRLTPHLYYGSESPPLGWVSRTFGIRKPSFILIARARIGESTKFLTKIAAN